MVSRYWLDVLISLALLFAIVENVTSRVISADLNATVPFNNSWNSDDLLVTVDRRGLSRYPFNISGTYKGTWVGQNFDHGNKTMHTSGHIIFQISSFPSKELAVHDVKADVIIRDGFYISDKDMTLKFEGVYVRTYGQLILLGSRPVDMVPKFGFSQNSSLQLHTLSLFKPRDNHQQGSCTLKITTNFKAATLAPPLEGEDQLSPLEMSGAVDGRREDSGHCFGVEFIATEVDLQLYYNKAVNYILLVTFTTFLQIYFTIRQMEHSNTLSGACRVSMIMVGQQAVIDSYLCLLHLTAGIILDSLFNAFATMALFKFIIFSMFEMRYLLVIWKARRQPNASDSWDSIRRELSILYTRFYGFLLAGIMLTYQLHSVLQYVLLVFYSFWIPQIYTSAVRDVRKPLQPQYIVGMSITRLVIPLYAFGCPKNFMRVEPNYEWCLWLVAFVGMQAALLLLQHYLGPRFFVPRQLLPVKYSYFRQSQRMSRQMADGGEEDNSVPDCVICMTPVPVLPNSMQLMVTPCEHLFHSNCLQKWMDIKMECPTCRRLLPPF